MEWRSPYNQVFPVSNQEELDLVWSKAAEYGVSEIMIQVSYLPDNKRNASVLAVLLTAMLFGITQKKRLVLLAPAIH